MTTLDIPVWGPGGFAPLTIFPYLCPVIALLLSVFGIGISPLTKEEQERELREVEREETEVFANS